MLIHIWEGMFIYESTIIRKCRVGRKRTFVLGWGTIQILCNHWNGWVGSENGHFCLLTPFENPQRWMGQNTFPILLLNDDNMIEEH